MEPQSLTLSQLTSAVGHVPGMTESARAADESLMRRRIRYWTLAGILPTEGARHAGTGKHRRYRPEAAYLAQIMYYMADWGLPIGVLKAVAETIAEEKFDQSDLWKGAIAARCDAYLVVVPFVGEDAPDQPGLVLELTSEEGLLGSVKRRPEGMYLNLTTLFKEVAL